MKKKLLIISYHYAPMSSCQSNKFELLIPYLQKEYQQIDILTSLHRGLEHHELVDNVNVHRVNHNALVRDYQPKQLQEIQNTLPVKKSRLKTMIKKAFHFFMWPDFAFLWIKPAKSKAIQLHQANHYTHVISLCYPFSCHLVGYGLKRKFSEIKLHLDYIDPFSLLMAHEQPSNNVRLYGWLNRSMERKVNSRANKVFVSAEAYASMQTYDSVSNVQVCAPWLTISRGDYRNSESYDFKHNGTKLLYIGTFFKSIRDPSFALTVLSKYLETNQKAFFVGDKVDCDDVCRKFELGFPNNFSMYSQVGKSTVLSMIKGCDVLIFIDNLSAKQLPSKILEYLYVKKRILFFAKDRKAPTYQFLLRENLIGDHLYFIFETESKELNMDDIQHFLTRENIVFPDFPDKLYPENIARTYG
ncbi:MULTISPECIES: hypothetical protein [Cysteiniphilum]|uniref:hypothetical protein n=1 Tax=Cysteiniphilum TaxID=2056696 RepID=UPI00177AB334|nr:MULTISPECIES: hypothetical protein [Cysteiniphilum]